MSTPAQAQPGCLALHKSLTSHRYTDADIAGSWEEVHDTEQRTGHLSIGLAEATRPTMAANQGKRRCQKTGATLPQVSAV